MNRFGADLETDAVDMSGLSDEDYQDYMVNLIRQSGSPGAVVNLYDLSAPVPELVQRIEMGMPLNQAGSALSPVAEMGRRAIMQADIMAAPPEDPEGLLGMIKQDPELGSCVDVTADATVGAGYEVVEFIDPQKYRLDRKPDVAQYDRLMNFLDAPNGDGQTFTQINLQLETDYVSLGNSYSEILLAGADDGPILDGVNWAPGIQMRVGNDRETFYQCTREVAKAFPKLPLPRLTNNPKTNRALAQAAALPYTARAQDFTYQTDGIKGTLLRGDGLPYQLEVLEQIGIDVDTYYGAGPQPAEMVVGPNGVKAKPYIYHDKMTCQYDSYYGLSRVAGCARESLITIAAYRFWQDFFDNDTIPPMLMVIKGTVASRTMEAKIAAQMRRRARTKGFHQLAILSLPDAESALEVVDLTSKSMRGRDLLTMLEPLEERKRGRMRVPKTMYRYVGQGSDKMAQEANRGFLSFVVRPRQKQLEAIWRRIIRTYLGVTDWYIKFQALDAISRTELADMLDKLLQRGVMTINEVRALLMGLPPVEGGDANLMMVHGQGLVLLKNAAEAAEARTQGRRQPLATGDQKTQPRAGGNLQQGADAGRAVVLVSGSAINYLSPTEAAKVLAITQNCVPSELVEDLQESPVVA